MAFGQPSGPPASRRQVETLLQLLNDAGHADFRDARGPMGFTQRQANGKFTRDEADALIAQLEDEAAMAEGAPGAPAGDGPHPAPAPPRARPARTSSSERSLRRYTDHELAAELQRRGWVVMEP